MPFASSRSDAGDLSCCSPGSGDSDLDHHCLPVVPCARGHSQRVSCFWLHAQFDYTSHYEFHREAEAMHLALARLVVLLLSMLSLVACATHPVPGISGRWTAVNHYAATPQEIPLHQAYVFYASPLDVTLKTMLARWARDSQMTLFWRHPSDFTLYGPVAQLRTVSVADAVARLSTLYEAQHVVVTVDGNAIVVRHSTDASIPAQTPAP